MKAILVLPLQVSPLIKLARWFFLISGIYCGVVKHKQYTIEATKLRAEEEIMKKERAAQFAREEAISNQETAKNIAEALTGLRVRFEEILDSEDNNNSERKSKDDDSTSKIFRP